MLITILNQNQTVLSDTLTANHTKKIQKNLTDISNHLMTGCIWSASKPVSMTIPSTLYKPLFLV